MARKKELDYRKIKPAKKQNLTANIGELAKESKVKPSDFKNRKAYLNYISKKAGYQNYNQWQKERRKAGITPGRGGRKPKLNTYTYTLSKLKNYKLEWSKIEKYFKKVNRSKDIKFFTIEASNIEKPIMESSKENRDINILLDWLEVKLTQLFDMHVTPVLFKDERDNAKVDITLIYDHDYTLPINAIDEDADEFDNPF